MRKNAYAKINIGLEVLGKRIDGNHEVSMIMQSVSLYDEITINKRNDKKVVITSNKDCVPTDSNNLVYKAYDILSKEYNIQNGVDIHIEKNIPVAAGLAGGSSDCAMTLKMLNEMFDLKINQEKLLEIGLRLGADIPFCVLGGTYLAEGKGEKLTKISDFPGCYIAIAKPNIFLSTGEIYQGLKMNLSSNEKLENERKRNPMNKLIGAIEKNDLKSISLNMTNKLEEVSIKKEPVIVKIKESFKKKGAIGSMMSGSGPSVFGLFETKKSANEAADFIREKYNIDEVFVCEPLADINN